jgi:hypothetical protein
VVPVSTSTGAPPLSNHYYKNKKSALKPLHNNLKLQEINIFLDNTQFQNLQGESENASHVLLCQDTRAKAKWQHDITVLNSWMLGNNTSPAGSDNLHQRPLLFPIPWAQRLSPKQTSVGTTL